jgi:hypothetical protein
VQEIGEEPLAFLIRHDNGIGKKFKDHGERARMVLFGMVDDDIVDPGYSLLDEICYQFEFLRGIDRIDKGRLLASYNQV